MKCPSCKERVNDSVDHCPACGFHLDKIGDRITGLPRKRGWFIDAADVIDEEHSNLVYEYLLRFHARTGIEFYVLTVPSSGNITPSEFVFYYLNQHRIGGPSHRGLVLALFEAEKTIACEVGYSLESVLSDDLAEEILQRDAVPLLKESKRGEALLAIVMLYGDMLRHGRSRLKRFWSRMARLYTQGNRL